MALLDKLQTQGSNLTALNGSSPSKYDQESDLVNANNQIIASDSVLDLDGKKPATYRDNAPENQGGRV